MSNENENQYPQPTAPAHPYNPSYVPAGQQPSVMAQQPVTVTAQPVMGQQPVMAQAVTAQPVIAQPMDQPATMQPVMAYTQTVTSQPVGQMQPMQPVAAQPVTAQPVGYQQQPMNHNTATTQSPVVAQAFVPQQYQQQPVVAQVYNPYSHVPASPPPPSSLSNPSAWFDYYDQDRSGSLTKSEVMAGLIQTFPANTNTSLQETVNSIWNVFDTDGNGTLDKSEFCTPGGFGESLQAAMTAKHRPVQVPVATANTWTCSKCTFVNSNSDSFCKMCQTIRMGGGTNTTNATTPGVYVPNSSSTAAATTSTNDSWSCSHCTYVNSNSTNHCKMCQRPRNTSSSSSAAEAAAAAESTKIRVGIPQGANPGQQLKIQTPTGKSETVMIPPRDKWVYLNTGQAAFDHIVVTAPPTTATSTTSAVATTTIRVGIPQGASSGQQIRIQTPAGKTETVIIPPQSQWVYLNTGQPAFDHKVGTTTSNSNSNSGVPQHPWQDYEQIITASYQSPTPLGVMKTVPVGLGSAIIQPSGRRRALIIGINYTGTRAALRGCINDAKNMRSVLIQKHAFPNDTSHIVLLTDEPSRGRNYQPTYSNIRRGLQWLLQGVSQGDVLFFHFSGHGAQIPDRTGHEADGLNETILPLDYERKQITDDELWGSIVYPLPAGARLTALMDCCHSGTGLDLPYEYKYKQKHHHSSSPWMEDLNPAHSQGDVVLISGCKDDQTSADAFQQGTAGGAMTQAFLAAYEQHPYCTYPELLQAIHQVLKQRRFTQRPQLTSSQPFNTRERIFSLVEGIEPNHQSKIGRLKKKHIRPGRTGGGGGADVGGMLLGGAGILGALALGDALFDF